MFSLFWSQFTEDNIIADGIHLLQGKKIEETTCQVKQLLFFFRTYIFIQIKFHFLFPFSICLT